MSAADRSPARAAAEVSVAAVVLAAGTSSRWGRDRSKQLHPWEGEPLVRRAARIAIESAAGEVVVVTGHDAGAVERTLAGLAVCIVNNRDYASGQASSVRTGIAALGGLDGDVDGALFVPCDQPLLDRMTLDLLIERFTELGPDRRSHALVPAYRGRRGAPALIGRDLFGALASLEGDEGGRRVLATVPDRVVEVEIASADPLLDVDTLEDLRVLERDHASRAKRASSRSGPTSHPTNLPDPRNLPTPKPRPAVSETEPRLVPPLPGLIPLEGSVRHYDWGSRTFLAALRAHPQPSAEPEAELWYGAHPTAPSSVRLGGRELTLDALIARHADGVLGGGSGAGTREPARHELPFLLKILAADRPLSIQLHPDAARARAGFEREEAQGIDRSATRRFYPDPNPKPEIACSLTPFQALQGLRPPLEARSLVGSLDCPHSAALLGRADPDDPAALLAAILSLGEGEATALATAAAEAARRTSTPEGAWVARLAESYPRDPLILAPFLLRLVELVPGEALYTPPGVIHSYLDGAVVELMGASDNVLRAGLTSKPVDTDELLAALDPAPRQPAILLPREVEGSGWREYPGTGPLRLSFVDVEWDAALAGETIGRPCILLAISGQVRARSRDGAELELRPGDAALVPASAPGFRLEGRGRIYRASAASD